VLSALAFALVLGAPSQAAFGATVQRSFPSQALGGRERYAVQLPAGYATSGRRYPVIYALHGLPNRGDGFRHMPIAAWGAIAERAGTPAIVVAPQGARGGDTDSEWHDWAPGRDWETAVAVELVRDVDSRLRTLADRRHRALIGMSAGGYGAALIGLHHLDTFSVIQAWSGYFHPTNPSGTAGLDVGSPTENAAASAHTYVPLLPGWFRRWQPTYLGFYVGAADWRFAPENRRLDRELGAAGIAHHFAVYRGGHTSAVWARHQSSWIRRALRELAS
jgi:putative tributyrin esterase